MTALWTGPAPATQAGRKACGIVRDLAPFLAEQAIGNDREARFARESVSRLGEAGLFGICAPQEYGGLGLTSLRDLGAVAVALGEADASVGIAAIMHLALTWYYARTLRHPPQGVDRCDQPEDAWLRVIGRGEMIVCSSVAEPGLSPWQLSTTAEPAEGGWRINGRKVLASISPAATHFYSRVKALTADGPMQGSVMIPLEAPGVGVLNDWDGLGLRGSGSGRLVFKDVFVPHEAVRMRGVWGHRDARGAEGRAAAGAPVLGVYLGLAYAARDAALDSVAPSAGSGVHSASTRSAGQKALIAEIQVRLCAASGAFGELLDVLDQQVTETAPRSLPPEAGRALMVHCATAGMVIEQSAIAVTDLAMQLCGGRSYSAGHPLGRIYRDVRAASFMRPYSPAENWVDFVADAVLDSTAAKGGR